MNYNLFLFSKLYDVFIGVDYYYDELFEDLQELNKEFEESKYNNPNAGLYECIVDFLKDNRLDILNRFIRNQESLGIKKH